VVGKAPFARGVLRALPLGVSRSRAGCRASVRVDLVLAEYERQHTGHETATRRELEHDTQEARARHTGEEGHEVMSLVAKR
jgi:hypothetical protein